MNTADIRALIIAALVEVAPEVTGDDLEGDADLREEYDIDSMDFLNFITALKRDSGVSIPERDYARLATLNFCVTYLEEKLAVRE